MHYGGAFLATSLQYFKDSHAFQVQWAKLSENCALVLSKAKGKMSISKSALDLSPALPLHPAQDWSELWK